MHRTGVVAVSLWVGACAGPRVHYLAVAATPETALEQLDAGAYWSAPADAGGVQASVSPLPDGGTRVEVIVPEGRELTLFEEPEVTLQTAGRFDPGRAHPLSWDTGWGASLAVSSAAPLTWRADAFARVGYAFVLSDPPLRSRLRWAIAPTVGMGATVRGPGVFGIRPQVGLSLSWQQVDEVVTGRPHLTGSRWALDLSTAVLVADGAGVSMEGELCLSSSRWGGPCVRVGSPLRGPNALGASFGYRLGAEPSMFLSGGALVALVISALLAGALGALASGWKPGGG
ncbi:MAG: hypothetical protein IPJ65_29040 [Archangiaceae bacterium]|nr:hypothetical protein [Archangiaceae bacterium]